MHAVTNIAIVFAHSRVRGVLRSGTVSAADSPDEQGCLHRI